jgi:hypothetical protein
MIKRLVLASAIAFASLVSFKVAQTAPTSASPKAPPVTKTEITLVSEANACWPPDYPYQWCACGCCYNCEWWGYLCPACR